ncbi:MAG TPA: hypothetical protein VN363_04725 [Anaerolineales bacterium]|nr:hypothetical protein [Anaerolineales bacterium]
MDNYLGRVLKNWAASSQPHANGRERLLANAASGRKPEQRKSGLETMRSLLSTPNYRGFHEEIRTRPTSQALIWSFQMVASTRLLA